MGVAAARVEQFKQKIFSFIKFGTDGERTLDLDEQFTTLKPVAPPATIQDQFLEFHKANPGVYEHLVDLAFEAKDAGYSQYSINGLFERLRWHYNIEIRTEEFKLNNNYRSRYARLIMKNEPELEGFFNLRQLNTN